MSPDGSVKPPPEEKLLRLIRGKGAKPAQDMTAPAQAAEGAATVFMTAVNWPSRARRLPWPIIAGGMLGAALALEVICLMVQAVWPLPNVVVPVAATSASPLAPADTANTPAMPDMPSLTASAARALFAPSAFTADASYASPSGSAKLLASRLTLMGIVSGNPAQAIIEDSQTQKTYFVTTGQAVVEGAVLEQVLDNRVVLDLGGEKIELTL